MVTCIKMQNISAFTISQKLLGETSCTFVWLKRGHYILVSVSFTYIRRFGASWNHSFESKEMNLLVLLFDLIFDYDLICWRWNKSSMLKMKTVLLFCLILLSSVNWDFSKPMSNVIVLTALPPPRVFLPAGLCPRQPPHLHLWTKWTDFHGSLSGRPSRSGRRARPSSALRANP